MNAPDNSINSGICDTFLDKEKRSPRPVKGKRKIKKGGK